MICGLTFDSFQQICHFRTDSYAKFNARQFCAQELTLSDASKWLKMGDFARNEKKNKENGKKSSSTCGLTFDSFQQIGYCSTNFKAKFDAQHFSA